MLNPRALLAIGPVCLLAACSSGGAPEIASADIAKIVDIKSMFGPEFRVTDIPPKGLDPKMLGAQKLPKGLKFQPAGCEQFAVGQKVPPGTKGNIAAVTAEGEGNRFIIIAVQTSEPVPFEEPVRGCHKVGFSGGKVRGAVEVVDVPHIDGTRTLGVHRVLQTTARGKPRTGELYNYSAHFGDYQVIVTANPLVNPDKPIVPVDTQRARDLLVSAVKAIAN